MQSIKLGTKFYSRFWIGVIMALVLLLPVIASWIYLNGFYTKKEIGCDGDFWQATIDNPIGFPFEFFWQMLIANPYMWVVIVIGIIFTLYWFNKGLQWIRLRDFPVIFVIFLFFISIFSAIAFWQSLDLFAKSKIEAKLTNDEYRSFQFDLNLESLNNALSNQVGISLSGQELQETAQQANFSDNNVFDRIGETQAGALFSKTKSKLALFETCKESIGIQVVIKEKDENGEPNGFTNTREVSIDAIMPIGYQNIAEKGGFRDKFDYFIDVFGVHYLFGGFWWIYYSLIMLPLWFFVAGFVAYRFGFKKIKGEA